MLQTVKCNLILTRIMAPPMFRFLCPHLLPQHPPPSLVLPIQITLMATIIAIQLTIMVVITVVKIVPIITSAIITILRAIMINLLHFTGIIMVNSFLLEKVMKM